MSAIFPRGVAAIGIVIILFIGQAAASPASGSAGMKKVVCFGDSITKAGYPEVLGQLIPAQVVNAGKGGHTTAQGLARIQKDVLDQKPDVVVVFFGTNDSRLAEPSVHVPLDKYEANLGTIIDQCRDVGAKVVLCTIPPINPEPYFKRHARENFDKAGGMERVVADYRSTALHVAKAKGVAVVDLNEILTRKPEWLAPDGVHPTKAGTTIIAEELARVVRPLLSDAPAGNAK
jgi:lysophospholipase L1-like esterase